MRDPTTEESTALAAIGYTEAWLELGVLNSVLLLAQYERMQSGGTKKTARYRAEASSAWLADGARLGDEEIDGFLALMRAEPDKKLAKSCIAQLIQSPRVDLVQLRARRSDEKLIRPHQALIQRMDLMQQMEGGVTDDHMLEVIESKGVWRLYFSPVTQSHGW